MFLVYIAMNLITIERTGNVIVNAPNAIKHAAKHLPTNVTGTISPYPKVVIVCIAHHKEFGMLVKPVLDELYPST